MRIGDEVYVHGYVDEIRNDVVIIRNDGGYFGTARKEIRYIEDDMIIPQRADTPQTETLCEPINREIQGVIDALKQTDCSWK